MKMVPKKNGTFRHHVQSTAQFGSSNILIETCDLVIQLVNKRVLLV